MIGAIPAIDHFPCLQPKVSGNLHVKNTVLHRPRHDETGWSLKLARFAASYKNSLPGSYYTNNSRKRFRRLYYWAHPQSTGNDTSSINLGPRTPGFNYQPYRNLILTGRQLFITARCLKNIPKTYPGFKPHPT